MAKRIPCSKCGQLTSSKVGWMETWSPGGKRIRICSPCMNRALDKKEAGNA